MTATIAWTREQLLRAIDQYLRDVVDEDAPGTSDEWMIAMLLRSTVLLKVVARYVRDLEAV